MFQRLSKPPQKEGRIYHIWQDSRYNRTVAFATFIDP
jgi:hypothetical protein